MLDYQEENSELKKEIDRLKMEVLKLQSIINENDLPAVYFQDIPEDNLNWKQVVDQLPIAVFMNGPNGAMWVNNAVETILGYSRQEYLSFDNNKMVDVVKIEDNESILDVSEYFGKYPKGKYAIMEYQMKKKSGEYAWILSLHFPLLVEEGVSWANIDCAIDISKRKEMELELKKTIQDLQESQEKEKQLLMINQQFMHQQTEQLKQELRAYSLNIIETKQFKNEIMELANMILLGNVTKETRKIAQMIKKKSTGSHGIFDSEMYYAELFNRLDPTFYQKLSQAYPELSNTEMKICSLLKLQLDTEQISTMMHLSRRTVEFHKYNIRKKLELTRKERLEQVMLKI